MQLELQNVGTYELVTFIGHVHEMYYVTSFCRFNWYIILYTVASGLSDINGTEGRSDNRKCRIIRKTSEKDEGKYQLNL
jgi:hypothetical protein